MSHEDFNDLDTLNLPRNVFHVREDGEFVRRVQKDVKKEMTMFWRRKSRLIALLVGVPCFSFVMILLAETQILENLWSGLLGFVGMFI